MSSEMGLRQPPWPCVENTVEFPAGDFEVRLWFERDWFHLSLLAEIRDLPEFRRAKTPSEVAEYLANNIPNLNAVQVCRTIDGVRFGKMIYCVPFCEGER